MGLDMYLFKKHRGTYPDEDVAYWRKANQIHGWFVENVQRGEDDCKEYYVSRKRLKKLLDTVNAVLQASRLVPGKVTNGYTLAKIGAQVVKMPNVEDGRLIADASVARALLPTQEGFFFGSTDYDEDYYTDLEHTRNVLTTALAEGVEGRFYYQSSW